ATVLKALLTRGVSVSCVRPGGAVAPAPGGGDLLVLGRFADAQPAEATDDATGVAVRFRDIAGLSTDQVVALVDELRGGPPARPWKPWFPVIDYNRCTNCMQCLSFCLFDVYGAPGGKIGVQKPGNCKTDCPACSRVCPEVAILFPKYKAGPINGDEVREQDVSREKMKVDISALLGGDIYAALRQRSSDAKARFSKERDEKRAIQERKMCLTKLQKTLQEALDIPAEVMNALPSMDMIRSKAAAAAGRAE
ncbi:MAG: Fe-S oxidoreductase, partial [Phycisphaerales bacterium]|nr:Fe-S oxidoreductase [Phycisphaerales bacterium]